MKDKPMTPEEAERFRQAEYAEIKKKAAKNRESKETVVTPQMIYDNLPPKEAEEFRKKYTELYNEEHNLKAPIEKLERIEDLSPEERERMAKLYRALKATAQRTWEKKHKPKKRKRGLEKGEWKR